LIVSFLKQASHERMKVMVVTRICFDPAAAEIAWSPKVFIDKRGAGEITPVLTSALSGLSPH
jgi:hypothetical protein